MEEVLILSSKDYEDTGKNHGDCIIINTGDNIIVYDCGSEEHAYRVIDYAKLHTKKSVIGIISHADSDHVDGFHTLHDEG
jgi:Cft2 family RNA processing exonuclease